MIAFSNTHIARFVRVTWKGTIRVLMGLLEEPDLVPDHYRTYSSPPSLSANHVIAASFHSTELSCFALHWLLSGEHREKISVVEKKC
jgi:hypothetical protein